HTAYPHGAAMMLTKKTIGEVGLMPEDYFLYYEEMAWAENFKKAGYEILVQPQARIRHLESVSVGNASPLKEYYMTRNRIRFVSRYGKGITPWVFRLYFALIVAPKTLLRHILHGRMDLFKSFSKGWLGMPY